MPKELYVRFLKDTAGTLKLKPIIDGEEVTPTAATITITDAQGNALPTPVVGDAATIANDGELSFVVIAGNTDLEKLYKAVWSMTVAAVVHERVQFYRVVKHIAQGLVTKEDIEFESPMFTKINFEDVTWPDFIDHQFAWIEKDMHDRGLFTFLMLRSDDLYFLHLYRCIEKAALSFREEEGDKFDLLFEEYKELYADQRNAVRLAYDSDNDGNLSEAENRTKLNRFGLKR